MKLVRITNIKPGSIVINSLKIVLAPGRFMVKDEAILEDLEVKELIDAKMVKVEDASIPIPKSKPATQNTGPNLSQPPKGKSKGKNKSKTGSINDEMGRSVIIIDRGEAKSSKMQSGVHSQAPQGARPVDASGNPEPEEVEEEPGEQFVTINK